MSSNLMPYCPAKTTVMLLAAGKGRRMLPFTKNIPKPLLKLGEHSLIEHHLLRLHSLGFRHIVINIAHLAKTIQDQLGNGSKYGLSIEYSDESECGALETAGGLIKALPIIQSDPFIVINADIWTDFDFKALLNPLQKKARLVLVENPAHNKAGDFALTSQNLVREKNNKTSRSFTFSGIALYQKKAFAGLAKKKQPLLPVLKSLIAQRDIEGQIYKGVWNDIGTPERLKQIEQTFR